MLCMWASQVVLVVKNPPASARDIRDLDTLPGSGRSPEKEMPGESQGQRHLEGYSPWGRTGSDTEESPTEAA